jgi:hypothetical protein
MAEIQIQPKSAKRTKGIGRPDTVGESSSSSLREEFDFRASIVGKINDLACGFHLGPNSSS